MRGTSSPKIVDMVRDAGASEVHMRIACPPITHPDFYGIDTPDRDKLLAATHDLAAMRKFVKADSLAFLSIEGLYKALGEPGRDAKNPQFTDHCFTGDYPTRLVDREGLPVSRQLSLLAEASWGARHGAPLRSRSAFCPHRRRDVCQSIVSLGVALGLAFSRHFNWCSGGTRAFSQLRPGS